MDEDNTNMKSIQQKKPDNAWQSYPLAMTDIVSDDDRKIQLIYKEVRGILNKLNLQNFDTLLGKMKDLDIDNQDRLQGVVDLVVDKAVDAPNFSVAYAKMCKELALMQVKTTNSTPDKVEIVNFRKLLITRCQMEFEKQSVDESVRHTKIKEIEECIDPDKKKDLQFDLEEYDRKLRMKSVGNIRFIGELFKQNMLTVKIMVRCLHNLLDNKDEESLECLCKLLTTIGKELENKNVDVSPIINTMKALANTKDGKISSRIRFMLQDVIDLRAAKWVPRWQDLNPKTIDQILEAETEQLSLDKKAGRGRNQRNRKNPLIVQTDKFKNKAPLPEEPLGTMSTFQTWSKRSQGLRSSSQITSTSNISSALDNSNLMDSDKRGSNRPKVSYHSKGPSLDRNYNKYDGRGSRSGSQHRTSNDSLNSSSQRSTSAPMFASSMGGPPPSRPSPANMGPPPSTAALNTSSVAVPSSVNAPTPRIPAMSEEHMTPRRDDRMGGGGGSMSLDRKAGRGRNQRNRKKPFIVQADKFKNKVPLPEETLGTMSTFHTWSKRSQALDNSNLMDSDKRGSNRPKDSYHSKGPSLNRNYNKYDGRGSRSGSQHRTSNDSSNSSSQRSTPAPMFSSSMGGPPPSRPSPANMGPPPSAAPLNTSRVAVPSSVIAPTPTIPAMSEEHMERSINNSIDEYVSGNAKVDEYFQAIASCIPQTEYSKVVMISYLRVFNKSQNDRLKTGELFAKLVKRGLIHKDDYCAGLEEILAQAEDLKIDVPKFWDYLAEILVDIVNEKALPLNRLLTISKKLISPNDISKLIACIFKLIVSKKGSGILHQLWQKSGVRLTDFLESSQVQPWIVENQLNFLVEDGVPASKQEQLSFEKIQEDLSALLRKKASHDEIFNWITENVGELVKENKFIRALATAIFEDSISPNFELQKHVLTNHSSLLLKYIHNKSNYELEGLYALQALIHKLKHPQRLLLDICTTLLDSLMFSQESFLAWEESNDPAEQEGKGMALKQLTAFICQLKENDDDDEDTSDEDAIYIMLKIKKL